VKKKASLKSKFTYVLILISFFHSTKAQILSFPIEKSNSCIYNHFVFCFGLRAQQNNLIFKLYRCDIKLKVLDSLEVKLGKGNPENYLQLSSDTLHNFLNVYVQQKEKNEIGILRFNKKNELVAQIDRVDIARLNNTSLFSSESLCFGKTIYSLKTETDSTGKQFYLNKYELKSESVNFDYAFKWQFPFERKNVRSAHLFYANKNHVLLFVMVKGGIKSGQWVLKINAETGRLIRGSKLNDKTESNTYFYGSSFVDEVYKSIRLVGQKFNQAQFDSASTSIKNTNALFTTIYTLEIDSIGDVRNRQEFKIPINDTKTGVKKSSSAYLLRLLDCKKTSEGGFRIETDVFRRSDNSSCYLYVNSAHLNFNLSEEKLALDKISISPNPSIEQFYGLPDKLDMNGKLCQDSSNQVEKLFYKPLTFSIKQSFKLDPEKNFIWVLTKTNTKKNVINYSYVSPVKKVYTITLIEDYSKTLNPAFLNTSPDSFIISTQIEPGKYQLKLFNW
jgi:hypothetical protein